MKPDPCLSKYKTIHSKGIKDLNIRAKTTKLLGANVRVIFMTLNLEKDEIPKPRAIQRNSLNFSKI